MDHANLKTGELAARAGVNVQTLRYYERRGLLREPRRRPSGYREYPPDAVLLIRFIKRAQDLGFTLAGVEDLLLLREHEGPCSKVKTAAETKIADIDGKIRHLRAMKHALGVLVQACTTKGSPHECPILEALDDRKERRR